MFKRCLGDFLHITIDPILELEVGSSASPGIQVLYGGASPNVGLSLVATRDLRLKEKHDIGFSLVATRDLPINEKHGIILH